MAESLGMVPWLTALIGFMGGRNPAVLRDRIFTRLTEKGALLRREDTPAGPASKRCAMLVFSITLHNIPRGHGHRRGLGPLAYGLEGSTPSAPGCWPLGIGLQKPARGHGGERPLRREGYTPKQAFFTANQRWQEPIAAVLGPCWCSKSAPACPSCWPPAAGAMILWWRSSSPKARPTRTKIDGPFTLGGIFLS